MTERLCRNNHSITIGYFELKMRKKYFSMFCLIWLDFAQLGLTWLDSTWLNSAQLDSTQLSLSRLDSVQLSSTWLNSAIFLAPFWLQNGPLCIDDAASHKVWDYV